MVHTGKPSRGCQTCRKRRIKCDEASPACSYCVKKKQPCPGYPDPFDLAWRDQTAVAEKSVLRRERANERSRQGSASVCRVKSSVPLPMREYPLDHALCFFFTGYVLITREPEAGRGYLEYLAPIYSQVKSQSPLKYATSAVATSLFESWVERGAGTFLSTSFYLDAISIMRQNVEERESYSVEELLLAIMLLDLYEGMLSIANRGSSTGMHIKGAVALIKHRKFNTFQSLTSQKLLLAVRSLLIDNSLKTSQSLPEDIANWSNIVPEVPQTAAMRLDTINIDVAKLQAIAAELNQTAEETQPECNFHLRDVVKFAQQIDLCLVNWSESLPASWSPLRITKFPSIPQLNSSFGLYQSQCDIYNNLFTAFTWNTYRCSRIRVHSVLQSCLARLPPTAPLPDHSHLGLPAIPSPPPATEPHVFSLSTRAILQHLVDDICYSIPFHLGDRNRPSRLDNLSIQFPHSDALPYPYPQDHYRAAGALGGWLILECLSHCLARDLLLRGGQREWIGGQIRRVMRIYNLDRRRV